MIVNVCLLAPGNLVCFACAIFYNYLFYTYPANLAIYFRFALFTYLPLEDFGH